MAEEILRRNLDRAFDPGPDFPHPSLLSRTMAAVRQDVAPSPIRRKAEVPTWLLPMVAVLLAIAIVAVVIGSNLLHRNSPVPVRPPTPVTTRSVSPQMMSPTSGWSNGSKGLLRTGDGGRHWKVVAKPSTLLYQGGPGNTAEGDYFLGPSTAWIGRELLVPNRPLEFVVFRTVDGGAAWQQSGVIAVPGLPNGCCSTPHIGLFFLDSSHGWLLTEVDASHQFLYATDDGGMHWALMSTNTYSTQPPPGPPSNPFNATGCAWGVPTFVTATVGYMGITVAICPAASNEASLLATSDGGRSWHLQPLGVGPQVTCSFGCRDPDPVFVDDSSGFIDAGTYGGSGWLLVTADAGQTWSVRPKPPGASEWLDPRNGWAFRQFRAGGTTQGPQPVLLYVTHDGGFTWTQVTNDLSGQVSSVYFVDQRNGFAVIQTADGTLGTQELASSTDGGIHWSIVGPIGST